MPKEKQPEEAAKASVAPRVVGIPLSKKPSVGDLWASIRLISYVIFPGIGQEAEEARFQVKCAIIYQAANDSRLGNSLDKAFVPLSYLRQSPAGRKNILRIADKQMENRLTAARISWPFLREVALRQVKLYATKMTIGHASEIVSKDASEKDATNIQSRIFRPSFPVLHMAVAIERFWIVFPKLGQRSMPSAEYITREMLLRPFSELPRPIPSVYQFVLFPFFARCMLVGGAEMAKLIEMTPKLRGAVSQLIHFRPVFRPVDQK